MTQQEILERTVEIVRACIPELKDAKLTADTVLNTDTGVDSMSFILVICKLEEAFGVRIPNRRWNTFTTLGQVVDAIAAYRR